MFYWLHLFDKHIVLKEELDIAEIKKIMHSFTLDFTRYISRLENPKYRKYVYTAQILLHYMLADDLLIFDSENNCLKLNLEDEEFTKANFKMLLSDLMSVTTDIKDIYATNDKEREDNVTKYYDEEALHILESLYKNFN